MLRCYTLLGLAHSTAPPSEKPQRDRLTIVVQHTLRHQFSVQSEGIGTPAFSKCPLPLPAIFNQYLKQLSSAALSFLLSIISDAAIDTPQFPHPRKKTAHPGGGAAPAKLGHHIVQAVSHTARSLLQRCFQSKECSIAAPRPHCIVCTLYAVPILISAHAPCSPVLSTSWQPPGPAAGSPCAPTAPPRKAGRSGTTTNAAVSCASCCHRRWPPPPAHRPAAVPPPWLPG